MTEELDKVFEVAPAKVTSDAVPLYTHPPAPTTPLTDDAIADVVSSFDGNEDWNLHDFARAVLAAQEARNV